MNWEYNIIAIQKDKNQSKLNILKLNFMYTPSLKCQVIKKNFID